MPKYCLSILLLSLSSSTVFAKTAEKPFDVTPIGGMGMHNFSVAFFIFMLISWSLWSAYKKELRPGLLILIAASLTSWQEFYGDWGAYIYWNSEFPLLPWGESPFTTPIKPAFLFFSWGWYFSLIYPFLLTILNLRERYLPKIPQWPIVLFVIAPIFYAYNINGEKTAAESAWWGYAHSFGPYASAQYADYPLIWPTVTLVAFSIAIIYLLRARNSNGYWWHERLLNIDKMTAGASSGLARIGAFVLAFNIACLVFVTIPCIAVRLIWGVDSHLVP
tara:strand:+ start:14338 stop:15165 length:828 start_codon:yes stop_codon:yes gene_type:complete